MLLGVLGFFFVHVRLMFLLLEIHIGCSAIIRAQDAEEALKALKGGLGRAAPESFMLWLHR